MKRLKKVAYSFSDFLYGNMTNAEYDIFNITSSNIEKIGDETSQDEQIKANIKYSILKQDVEYVIKLRDKITEEQWDNFYKYLSKINVVDFEDFYAKYRYDALNDIKKRFPNENLDNFEIEYFKFYYITHDEDTISFELETRLNKVY